MHAQFDNHHYVMTLLVSFRLSLFVFHSPSYRVSDLNNNLSYYYYCYYISTFNVLISVFSSAVPYCGILLLLLCMVVFVVIKSAACRRPASSILITLTTVTSLTILQYWTSP